MRAYARWLDRSFHQGTEWCLEVDGPPQGAQQGMPSLLGQLESASIEIASMAPGCRINRFGRGGRAGWGVAGRGGRAGGGRATRGHASARLAVVPPRGAAAGGPCLRGI